VCTHLAAANHDDGFGEEIEAVIVAGRWNVAEVADDLPARAEHGALLALEEARIAIRPGRQAEIVFRRVDLWRQKSLCGPQADSHRYFPNRLTDSICWIASMPEPDGGLLPALEARYLLLNRNQPMR
jgi:hypothetical protein